MSRKVSLHVGINAYSDSPLSGCVNDAHDWRRACEERGYSPSILLDGDAQKSAMVEMIRWAAAELRSGDRYVFTYSGHGSWGPDRGVQDEPDGRDECLVPVDYRRAGMLWDDELHELVQSFRPGVRRLILSDSCHSGTVTRGFAGRAVDPNARPRFLPPADWIEDPKTFAQAVRVEGTSVRALSRTGAVLISGSSDLEFSYDVRDGNRPRGAFTWKALQALQENPRSVVAWHRAIRKRLGPDVTPYWPQSPQLTATVWQRYGYRPL